jgi:hypothetical protein
MSQPVHPIHTRAITVLYQEAREQRGKLVYFPRPMADEAPEREYKEIARPTLAQDLDAIRDTVKNLANLALMGRERGEIGIEEAARQLTRHVTPDGAFERILGTSFHPRFDIGPDLASSIPWELLEESQWRCGCGPANRTPEGAPEPCPKCGRMPEARQVNLALARHVSHLVPGRAVPRAGARTVLLVHDPLGDLCSRDPTPGKICVSHLDAIAELLRQRNYEVDILSGACATRNRFLQALRNTDLAGLYFFGHGWYPREGDEGCILLADGEIVASAIEELALAIPFVFLNACEGAAVARDWDLERRHGNVAAAFARSPNQTVVAPLWPVINYQAAESALEFFQKALAGEPLADALGRARQTSHQRYLAGSPHISWMAYRYFGNPNHTLALPEQNVEIRAETSAPAKAVPNRFFDERGVLNTESTGFDLLDVLIRAAKRRNLHHRKLVSSTDFLAGLTRKGNLTRWVLRSVGVDPDGIYKQLTETVESPATADDVAFDLAGRTREEEILTLWVISRREQFAPALLRILDAASQGEREPDASGLISEQSVLSAFLSDPASTSRLHPAFPLSEALRKCLDEGVRAKIITANGGILLDGLDPRAEGIIAAAHLFSQQRRISPIPHRLFLASLLAESDSCAARLCRLSGGDPEKIFLAMLAAAEPEKTDKVEEPMMFGLTADVCSRVVAPVLQEARHMTPAGSLVGEMELVRAFCAQADPSFKEALKTSFLAVDLNQWPALDQDALQLVAEVDAKAWKIIQLAHEISCQRGLSPIPNRALLAAFLSDPNGAPARALCRPQTWRETLCQALVKSMPANPPVRQFLSGAACARSVTPMIEHALGNSSARPLDVWSLFEAFCRVTDPRFKLALKEFPFLLDLDTVAAFPPAAGTASPSAGVVAIAGFPKEQFDESGWNTLINALMMARCQNCAAIHTTHLWAALLMVDRGAFASRMKSAGLSPEWLLRELLKVSVEAGGAQPGPRDMGFSGNAFAAMKRAIEIARNQGRTTTTESDLCAAVGCAGSNTPDDFFREMRLQLPGAITFPLRRPTGLDSGGTQWN